MHAEQNALISAARFGNAVERAVIYSTMRPCFDYTKAALQAKIQAIHYPDNWEYPIRELREQYELIQSQFRGGVHQVSLHEMDLNSILLASGTENGPRLNTVLPPRVVPS